MRKSISGSMGSPVGFYNPETGNDETRLLFRDFNRAKATYLSRVLGDTGRLGAPKDSPVSFLIREADNSDLTLEEARNWYAHAVAKLDIAHSLPPQLIHLGMSDSPFAQKEFFELHAATLVPPHKSGKLRYGLSSAVGLGIAYAGAKYGFETDGLAGFVGTLAGLGGRAIAGYSGVSLYQEFGPSPPPPPDWRFISGGHDTASVRQQNFISVLETFEQASQQAGDYARAMHHRTTGQLIGIASGLIV